MVGASRKKVSESFTFSREILMIDRLAKERFIYVPGLA